MLTARGSSEGKDCGRRPCGTQAFTRISRSRGEHVDVVCARMGVGVGTGVPLLCVCVCVCVCVCPCGSRQVAVRLTPCAPSLLSVSASVSAL